MYKFLTSVQAAVGRAGYLQKPQPAVGLAKPMKPAGNSGQSKVTEHDLAALAAAVDWGVRVEVVGPPVVLAA